MVAWSKASEAARAELDVAVSVGMDVGVVVGTVAAAAVATTADKGAQIHMTGNPQ